MSLSQSPCSLFIIIIISLVCHQLVNIIYENLHKSLGNHFRINKEYLFFFLNSRLGLTMLPWIDLYSLMETNLAFGSEINTHLCLPQFWDKRYETLYLAFFFFLKKKKRKENIVHGGSDPACFSLGIIELSVQEYHV